jgi:hypothetical protein
MVEKVTKTLHSSGQHSKWPDLDLHYLVFEADDFIVYLDSDLDVEWQTSEDFDKSGPNDPTKHNQTLNLAASLECVPNDHHRRNVRLNFKRMVGEGVARSLDHDYDSANKILEQARLYIADRNVETARLWQLSTGCILGVLSFIGGYTLWSFRHSLVYAWGDAPFFLLLAGAAGCTGAVFSMIFRMGHNFPTSEAPRQLHILEAASRVLAGFMSGVLTAGAIRVGLLLPILGEAGKMQIGMLVAAMCSGASERLVPSLIAKLENDQIGKNTKKG